MATRFLEIDEAHNLVTVYVKNAEGKVNANDARTPRERGIVRGVLNAFLPAGYPKSVTPDYAWYQIYDSLQAFSSAIAGMLSSRAVLEGIGVGDSHASPTAALLLSVLQDSMGRIATILFAHRLGTSLEPECKMYRLAADVFNDAAMILDCLSPALPKGSRVVLLSCSSVLRSLCGVAAGSSKASLSAHFATQGNLGELNAKDSSQETVISLMGMLVGSVIVSHISSQFATWTAMIALLAIHLGTNYLAVCSVSMRTLNRQRANLLLSTYLDDTSNNVPSPEAISAQEKVFEKDGVLRWKGGKVIGHCEIGVPLQRILDQSNPQTITTLFHEFHNESYLLWYNPCAKSFLIVLKTTSSTITQLHAWMHALYIARQIQLGRKLHSVADGMKFSRSKLGDLSEKMLEEKLKGAGWDTEIGALETVSGRRLREDRVEKGACVY